ncbi:conjugal transfer protein [Streptococcus ovis]|uniref:conjugal transfer protein n=1 Tax=Streptococcus ovis TaxID=82806 RepID=UPI000362C573|nr:conjugal transfer protein [Streptococcus ovis]
MNFEKLIDYISQFCKVKKVKEKPSVKHVRQRSANFLVYGMLFLFVSIGLLGSLRAISLSSQVSSLQMQVKEFKGTVSDFPTNQTDIDISKLRQYMFDFLKVYINYTDETASDRQVELQKYYSFSNDLDSSESVNEVRTLTGQNMIGLNKEGDLYIADLKLSYDTVEEGKTVSRLRVLAVPFKTENGLFSIVSPPFYKQEDVLTGKSEALLRKKTEDVERVDEEVSKSIKEFLSVFFEKYASSNETDLALLMKTPFYMGGQYVVESINDSSVLIYKKGDNTIVQLSVIFKDRSGSTHSENFTLYLVKQDSGWFVNDLYHYFK